MQRTSHFVPIFLCMFVGTSVLCNDREMLRIKSGTNAALCICVKLQLWQRPYLFQLSNVFCSLAMSSAALQCLLQLSKVQRSKQAEVLLCIHFIFYAC